MKRRLQILALLICGQLTAQNNSVQTIYFEFDKFSVPSSEIKSFYKKINRQEFLNSTSIHLYGYCDDRGSEDYNNKLSMKRVDFVQKILIANRIPQNKIYICEGRGKVNLDKDTIKNLKEVRDKNRRVDLVFVKNTFFTYFPEKPKAGDNIALIGVTFDMGSSQLSQNAKKELDRTALILKKHKTVRFEIKGHVCCTSNKYKDAIDIESQKRNLSENRAKNVFNYLRSKGISPYRMSFKGYGNQFPLGKENALDRRVELYITHI